jgi:diguanylate cyclase (GGDEF)-like protein/PAS domain S-box-containing protein
LVYYGFGLLVKPLLLPPTYAAPVWPSAGIGVGVILLFGYRYIPALVIGEFLINYQFYKFDNSSEDTYLIYTYIALLLSTIIRSTLGAYLVKKYVGKDNVLLTLQSIISLFVFSAIIPVTLTAFLSTYVLTISGLLNSDLFLTNYSAWWFGDNVGIYIILPLMFVLFKKPKTLWRNRFLTTFIPVMITLILLIVVALNVKKIEGERIQDKLETARDAFSNNLLKDFSVQMKGLHKLDNRDAILLLDQYFAEHSPDVIKEFKLEDININILSKHDNGPVKIFETTNQSKNENFSQAKSAFSFFNHKWLFEISAKSSFYTKHSTWLIWWLLSLGFLFISFLESGLLVISGNSILINKRVEQRTKKIESLNKSLKSSEEKYKQMVEIQPVMFWKHTLGNKTLDFLSEEAEKIMGYDLDELMKMSFVNKIIDARDIEKVNDKYFKGAQSLKRFEFKYRVHCKNGKLIWLKDFITPNYNAEEDSIELLGIKIDITKDEEKEKKIKQLAYYDSMTNLPNRQSFMLSLQEATLEAQRTHSFGAILYLDLDRFKVLNDSMGHYFGDELLKKVAIRLTSIIRKGDVCSRFGGDEFVILLQNKDSDSSEFKQNTKTIALKIIKGMQENFVIDGYNFHTSFSIGISIFPDVTNNPDEIIQQADIAMYASKAKGGSEISFFEKSMQKKANKLLRTEEFLMQAFIKNEFEMYYQPIFNREKEVCHLEALIRWNHPEDGLVLPDSFIGIAEESGIIIEINEWIFDNVFKTMGRRKEQGKRIIPTSINVSLFQFRHTKIVEVIEKYTNQYAIDASCITLELTESIAIEDFEDALSKLYRLKEIGVKLAIDDFGSGYSSLKYLTKMPIDMLKIDISFIRNLNEENSSEVLIETIVTMAQKLNLDVVAEGVETAEQFELLKKIGCEYFQGFLVNKALPYKKIDKLI